jgi:N-acetylmuramoyl-L-alanine amidase
MRAALGAAAVLLLTPAAAHAVTPTMTVRDVPLHATRSLAASAPRFNMVGLHWRGAGTVSFRVQSVSGRWGDWTRSDDDDRIQGGWHLGGLDWTGAADAIRFRTTGHVTRLRAYYVSSPVDQTPARRLQLAGSPVIIPRFAWQADESIRRHPPRYADGIHYAVIHHTAGTSSYTRAQSAAIVRGIELYHVKGNGWWDIGYNFLVDKYGQVFEGRYGGVDRPVIGAHALGFNIGSVGISLIGDYSSVRPSAAAISALERLLAWKLDLAHVDPLSTLTWKSSGNPRFAAGVPVFLRAISGHRDTGFTDCPGSAFYALLPSIATDVAALGGPKIYSPTAVQSGEGQVHFTARLSRAQPWTVTVTNSSGAEAAQGSGTGSTVDWTWDGSAAPPDRYSWTIASPDARPAAGSLGSNVALALQKAVAAPAAVAPGEPTTVSYTLTTRATVVATLASAANETLATLVDAQKPAGVQTLTFTPPPGIANGPYTILVTATSGSRAVNAAVPLTIEDILTGFTVKGTQLSFTLSRPPLSLVFQVLRGSSIVATPPLSTPPAAGTQVLTWDKLLADGSRARDGVYRLALTVTYEAGTFTSSADVTLDATAPKVQVLSYRDLRFRIGEASTLRLVAGGRSFTRTLTKPATIQFWLRQKPARYVLTATDAAGNVTTVRYPR